jgi:hypothetical protein
MLKWIKEQLNYRAKYLAALEDNKEASKNALMILGKYEALTAKLPLEHELSTQIYWKDYADCRLMRENKNLRNDMDHLRGTYNSLANQWIDAISHYGVEMYGKWQPIEIAPKDGTPILASLGPFMYIVFWSDHSELKHPHSWWEQGHAEWVDGKWIGYHEHYYPASPTHWKPLPEKLK